MRQTKEMRLVYRDFLIEHSAAEEKLAVLEADLSSSMATNQLESDFGQRYVDVGIMEQEMIGLAAGLSLLGYKPYVHTFAPFISRRVFDQVFLSLGYAQLNATLVGSDVGITAEMNGGTHMPFEDLGLMRLIPEAKIFEVSDDIQFKAVLERSLELEGLKYIRTTRKSPQAIYQGQEDFSRGYYLLKEGKDLNLLASGIMVEQALRAAECLEQEGISVGVLDLFQIKPLPHDLLQLLVGKPVITVENHNRIGGLGSSICELLAEVDKTPVYRMGIDERFGQVGHLDYLLKDYGLSPEHICQKIKQVLAKNA
ncbi:transketolase family protein [Streptococcus oricebi]|uniref:Transketolase n=1 Tax=Streptococcus oricebi TaxID=1547447 RepID=A0ABS5B498_9STRE|nr:transketolase C-terminal domain-containing protein [Streptococcus oricebi]MBP2623656.1 transketolase [Streptococcus oricebi]